MFPQKQRRNYGIHRLDHLDIGGLRAAAAYYLKRTSPASGDTDMGLCSAAEWAYNDVPGVRLVDDFRYLQRRLHERWPGFGGDTNYPVPVLSAGQSEETLANYSYFDPDARDAYWHYSRGVGAYGFARRDLAGFMAGELLALALWLEAGNPCPEFEVLA